MGRSRRRARQAALFEPEEERDELAVALADAPLELPLDLDLESEATVAAPVITGPAPSASPLPSSPPGAAGARLRGPRLLAGLLDLGAHLLVAAAAVIGSAWLGVTPRTAQLPGFALLLLVVSLFYTVVPLAFWGHTPGMAAFGLDCRGEDGQPPAFAEAARRWLGGLLTVLLLGLPALLLLGEGRSLADRLSGGSPVRG